MAQVTVYPATLRWAVKTSGMEIADVTAKKELRDLPQWLASDTPFSLSFSRLSQLGKVLQVPFGSLVRSVVPAEKQDELIKSRTIQNVEAPPSKDLQDIIRVMCNRQDWAKDELVALGFGENNLVGCMPSNCTSQELGAAICTKLQLDSKKILNKNATQVFKYLRERASDNGLLVMVDSAVNNNRRRRLKIDEFRAFVLIDNIAPLIFINRNYSYSGMVFSLLHEIGHVFLGSNEILNDGSPSHSSRTETLINRAVMHVLVEESDFRAYWKDALGETKDIVKTTDKCAKRYVLSPLALTIHAKNLGLATNEDVLVVTKVMQERLEQQKESISQEGNQNYTNAFHLDSRFVELVKHSIDRGSLGYTDGFSLLGIKSIRAYDRLLRTKGMKE